MRLYIWERIIKATENYHSEGALVVIAADESRARALARDKVEALRDDERPDHVREADGPEQVWVFPDAGCC